jgi:RND family efflux transporter MFP subunit
MKTIYSVTLLVTLLMSSNSYAADYDSSVRLSPEVNLGLPVSGLVETIKVKAGQQVSKGDELLSLDQTPLKTARLRAQSKLAVQKTLLAQSQRDLEQQKELFDRTVLATVELEDAELREKRDRANLADAQGALSTANYMLGHSKLEAPFDAIIMSVNVNQGQYINNSLQGVSLISIARQGQYQTRFDVPLAELVNVMIDQPVTIKVAGKTYPGRVTSIDYRSVADSDGKRFAVAAEFVSNDKAMLLGQKASVHIE